jgi:hypothetical protein
VETDHSRAALFTTRPLLAVGPRLRALNAVRSSAACVPSQPFGHILGFLSWGAPKMMAADRVHAVLARAKLASSPTLVAVTIIGLALPS